MNNPATNHLDCPYPQKPPKSPHAGPHPQAKLNPHPTNLKQTMKPTITWIALLLAPFASVQAADAPSQKPNIAIFLAGDLRPGGLGMLGKFD